MKQLEEGKAKRAAIYFRNPETKDAELMIDCGSIVSWEVEDGNRVLVARLEK